MKIKKITVEYDNGVITQFTEEELDALQKLRSILELIDTSTNIAEFMLKSTVTGPCYGPTVFGKVQNLDEK